MQNIWTDRKGQARPIQKDTTLVRVVMVIDTAASDILWDILSGTVHWSGVRLQAARSTNVSSNPIPIIKNGDARLIPMNSIPRYMQTPKAAKVAIVTESIPLTPNQGFDLTESKVMQVMMLWRERFWL